jgi:hypothetical protein
MMNKLISFALSTAAASLVTGCGDNAEPEPDDTEEAIAFPMTCDDVKNGLALPDGTYTLYAYGEEDRPWTAFCHENREYLSVEPSKNFGEYEVGGNAVGTAVRTQYSRLRIDPRTFKVDITDQTFASSSGDLMVYGVEHVKSMPLGIAMSCAGQWKSYGHARIDLIGSAFAIDSAWRVSGYLADGSDTLDNDGQTMALNAAGECGWNAPAQMSSLPTTVSDGWVLQLRYRKP